MLNNNLKLTIISIQSLLIFFKVIELLKWSWWMILSPLWIPFFLVLNSLIFLFIIHGIDLSKIKESVYNLNRLC